MLLNNTSFGTKHNIQNLQNTQLKFVLQNGLQQQRNNPHIQILNWDCTCDHFLKQVRSYYKPTENPIILNFEFRQLVQVNNETVSAFCKRVEAAGKTCSFCECDSDYSAEEYAICDQIVIGTTNENICEKTMIRSWNLTELRQKGMKYESAAAIEEKISGCEVNKVVHERKHKLPPNLRKLQDDGTSSRPEVFCQKDIIKNFAKFTGKHLCQSLFFNKVDKC